MYKISVKMALDRPDKSKKSKLKFMLRTGGLKYSGFYGQIRVFLSEKWELLAIFCV